MPNKPIQVALVAVDAATTIKIQGWLQNANGACFTFLSFPELHVAYSQLQNAGLDLIVVNVDAGSKPYGDLLSALPLLSRFAPVIVLASSELATTASEMLVNGQGDVLLHDNFSQAELLHAFRFGLECRQISSQQVPSATPADILKQRCKRIMGKIDEVLTAMEHNSPPAAGAH
jgi:hypothetical protein